MTSLPQVKSNEVPEGITVSKIFNIQVRVLDTRSDSAWSPVTAYTTSVASVNTARNEFDTYPIAIASLSMAPKIRKEIKVHYNHGSVHAATIRPVALGINTLIEDNTILFTLDQRVDVMLEINNDKWQAVHLLTTEINTKEPTADTEGLWYFGPGVNNGSAYSKVHDGVLTVPSDTTIYLARDAFLTAQVHFANSSNASIRGPGFIYREPYFAAGGAKPRELAGGAILIERSSCILVENVTSLRSFGFSLPICEGHNIHINNYRSFSSCGNGDGIDLFCCSDVLIEHCFLRNSDDTIAIYGHRWDYYGDTKNVRVRNCTLLPDIAHPIQIGTHGNPQKPETFSNIHISGIDILDHHENQLWYQGCIAINAADENLIQDILIEDVRVEKITKGQLFNIRVMKNAMWTTAPGRAIKNLKLRNIVFDNTSSPTVNPSLIMGFDESRKVEDVTFENLRIGGQYVHSGMAKPRWYMVEDFVPLFVNEHVGDVVFKLT
ncbi:hypothetical protein N0V90_007912 [Kalmusia sp. IMI 367209]|nr:hypothetical protein N0V90_007912 [Kalmusia sp. IMI 367209]